VKLSKKKLTAGESIRVEVQLSDAARDVTNNGVYGPSQFLQYRDLQWSDCGSSVSSMLVNHCLFALAGIVALIPLAAEAQSGPIVENFYIACANAQNGTPFLPQGWTANPDPSVVLRFSSNQACGWRE